MNSEAAQLSEKLGSGFLARLWQVSSGALVLCDTGRRILAVNQEFTTLFGYTEKECVGADLDRLLTPAPYIAESDTLSDLVLDGSPISVTALRKDSRGNLVKVYLSSSAVLKEERGSCINLILRMVPREEVKRRSDFAGRETMLEAAFENSFEPSMITDRYGTVLSCNSAFSTEFDMMPQEISGKNVSDFFIPEEIIPEADYINAMARAGRTIRLRTVRKRADGTQLQVSLLSVPTGSGNMNRVYRTDDSTAHTRADLVKRNSLRGYPDPNSGNGMLFQCRTDRNRTMEFILPGSAAFTGYTEEELISGKTPFSSLIHDLDREMVLRHVQNSLKTGDPYSITYRMSDRSGRTLWVMEQGHARRTGEDSLDFCEGCVVDITETREGSGHADDARLRIDQLHSVAGELQRSRSVGEIYRICAEAGKSILNCACSCIFLADGDTMKIVASAGRESYPCDNGCGLDMASVALSTSGPCYFRSRDRSEGFCPAGSSGVCFKLGNRAVFQVMSAGSGVFGSVDSRIMELLIGYTEQALKRIALQHQLINQALHDPLTGTYNRNYFNRLIQLEEHRARRLDSSISFVMVDIDNFKNINDRYGHQAGDRVLQEVARILETALRKTDTVLRYGGDEFLIILTRMTSDYTHIVEERITSAMERMKELPEIDGTRVTLSMGHAYWTPDVDRTIDEILKLADMIMLENKKSLRTQ